MLQRKTLWFGCLACAGLVACCAFAAAQDTFKKYGRTFQVGPNPSAIVAVDLNGDGIPEIVAANTGALEDPRQQRPANNEMSLLVPSGPLNYAAEPPLRTDFAPYSIAVAPISGDKSPDLIVGSFLAVNRQDISVFRNLGGNLFESLYFRVPNETLPYNRMRDANNDPVFTKPGITSLAVEDFNHDGYRDIVATGWSSDVLIFMPGGRDTNFGEPVFIPANEGPRDVKAVDLDGDKELDLAVTLYSTNEVGIWKGDGKGGFAPATRFSSRGRLPDKIRVCDLNGDGKKDLIVSHCFTDDSIVVFYGEGGFEFSVSQEILLGKDRDVLEEEIRDIVVTDLDGDGKPDIAAACYGSKRVVVLINESEGASLPQKFRLESYPFETGRPRALCAADFNNDGGVDIGVALWDANSVALLLGKPKSAAGQKEAASGKADEEPARARPVKAGKGAAAEPGPGKKARGK